MQLNDKIYPLDPRVALPDPVDLPVDWLSKLAQKCGELLVLSNGDTKFLKHAGPDSTYRSKKFLSDTLKHFYQLLSSKEKLDGIDAIAMKLNEGARNCTPGFHSRVNSAFAGYLRPINLNGRLEQVRIDIVETVASQNTVEVHVYNRFYTVAENEGYGIRANNNEDVYHGRLFD